MPEHDHPPCPLCGSNRKMKRPKPLYSTLVCRGCHTSFANRRHGAYVLDVIIFMAIYYAVGIPTMVLAAVLSESAALVALAGIWVLMILLFLAKDGFAGHSPGKAICGIQVMHRHTGEPIGFGQSMGRNVWLLIPFMPIIVAIMLMDGYRPGDSIANTKVIWKRHARKAVFLGHAACEQCQYDLTGTRTPACPGCGTPISDSNRAMLGPAVPTQNAPNDAMQAA